MWPFLQPGKNSFDGLCTIKSQKNALTSRRHCRHGTTGPLQVRHAPPGRGGGADAALDERLQLGAQLHPGLQRGHAQHQAGVAARPRASDAARARLALARAAEAAPHRRQPRAQREQLRRHPATISQRESLLPFRSLSPFARTFQKYSKSRDTLGD